MESDDLFGAIGSFLGGIFGGNKKAKQTAAQLAAVSAKVDILAAENVKQTSEIKWLLIGLGLLAAFVIFFIYLKKRRR